MGNVSDLSLREAAVGQILDLMEISLSWKNRGVVLGEEYLGISAQTVSPVIWPKMDDVRNVNLMLIL